MYDCIDFFINPWGSSDAHTRRWTGSSLVHVMACRLFGAKPLPEPMLAHRQLDSWEPISVKFESKFYHFHSRKFIQKCRLPKRRPFCPGGDELVVLPHDVLVLDHYLFRNCFVACSARSDYLNQCLFWGTPWKCRLQNSNHFVQA